MHKPYVYFYLKIYPLTSLPLTWRSNIINLQVSALVEVRFQVICKESFMNWFNGIIFMKTRILCSNSKSDLLFFRSSCSAIEIFYRTKKSLYPIVLRRVIIIVCTCAPCIIISKFLIICSVWISLTNLNSYYFQRLLTLFDFLVQIVELLWLTFRMGLYKDDKIELLL